MKRIFFAMLLFCSPAAFSQDNTSTNQPTDVKLAPEDGPFDPDYPMTDEETLNQNSSTLNSSLSSSFDDSALIKLIERGPNHRVWETVLSVTNGDDVILQTNRFTEVASGMHFQ